MKVLMFGWEFPPHISGGLGTACYGLTKGLVKTETEILFVVPKAYGDEDANAARFVNASEIETIGTQVELEKLWGNISFIQIDSTLVPYVDEKEFNLCASIETVEKHEKIFRHKYDFTGKYGANLMEEVARYALVAANIAKDNAFDVIHAHDWLTYAAGIMAKRVSGKPLVIHVHATEFDRTGENVNPSVFNIEKQGMEQADKVITVSNLTRNIVINKYGINPEKVITVHNAVDFQGQEEIEIKRNVEDKIITFLGRITYQKGPEYFIEAACKVLKRCNNVRFVMAGSGDMMKKMVRRVAKLGMGTRFHFTGFLKGVEVQQMFAMSDVYVMPSVSEPFGISPLEAMRSNIPVIISKQSGVSEVLKYAIKIDFWDVDAMADLMYGLVTYPSLSKFFVRKGQAEVNSLKWEKAATKIRKIYNQVTDDNKNITNI
ncbi:MAG: glycosyltransferase family 4 protein [Prevotellaceae bacterium]|jgi:glycosyltransferase involved in cell wall biosynthesis|nr:glycosyltransferase family 4 protein [Prevotellaceae bacterium]